MCQRINCIVQSPEVRLPGHDHAENECTVGGCRNRYWRERLHLSLREKRDSRSGSGSDVVDVCDGWRVWGWLAGLVVGKSSIVADGLRRRDGGYSHVEVAQILEPDQNGKSSPILNRDGIHKYRLDKRAVDGVDVHRVAID